MAPNLPRASVHLSARPIRREPGRPPRRRGTRRTLLPVALTGTPGTGKSTVARLLARRYRSAEVGALALRCGAGHREGRGAVLVDLRRLRSALRRSDRPAPDLLVGHLAHLLPVRAAIVLRCHPGELAARLQRGHRGSVADRRANFVCEATDIVLSEALEAGLPVYEVDTTGRTPRGVAREVARWLTTRGRPRFGRVDWLSDRTVTAHLLERPT
jgi:adenylate kinase